MFPNADFYIFILFSQHTCELVGHPVDSALSSFNCMPNKGSDIDKAVGN